MFSGIVEELGTVVENAIATRGRLVIAATDVLADARIGDSIAVNGCCLTVVESSAAATEFAVDVMPETARLTNLGALPAGSRVNLEASLRLGERIGGHLVTGHVDAVGSVKALTREANAVWVTLLAPPVVADTLVPKGCVAVDGISLTVVDVDGGDFRVSLIPHTVSVTTAATWEAGSAVNLEADMLAKYVARAVAVQSAGAAT